MISAVKMATAHKDYSHRTLVQKLGVKAEERVEVAGDVGTGLRRDVKEAARARARALGRARRRDRAGRVARRRARAVFSDYRPRLRDTGYLWVITRKRGHEGYLDQMRLVPYAKTVGLIDNKTCSIDERALGNPLRRAPRAAQLERIRGVAYSTLFRLSVASCGWACGRGSCRRLKLYGQASRGRAAERSAERP